MTTTKLMKVALLGNPNSGKSTLFNQLTGLRQKVGNFPGVTVEKKVGKFTIQDLEIELIDFPGVYSLYPTSKDERVVTDSLSNLKDENYPDAVIYVADATNLEKQLLFFHQLRDLGFPIVLVLSMLDLAERDGLEVNVARLEKELDVKVFAINGRSSEQIESLKHLFYQVLHQADAPSTPRWAYQLSQIEHAVAQDIEQLFPDINRYHALLLAHHYKWLSHLTEEQKNKIEAINQRHDFMDLKLQIRETMQRFDRFAPLLPKILKPPVKEHNSTTEWLDRFLTHRFWGVIFFFFVMLLMFQSIYAWASYPMDWIEGSFSWVSQQFKALLPDSWFASLLTDGILAGLGGVIVFIPQIAVLFFLISILEEVGYMARAVFLFDRLMQRFGLNGRSIVALISSSACAIPAIMSARTIANPKERLITILVTPLISCSARIPVYTVLIGFVVPAITVGGIFNAQGLVFMGLYLLGILAALLSALVFKYVLKSDGYSFLMLELPEYRIPVFKNVLLTVWEKVKSFVLEAGKVIMLISVVLWFLASYGPPRQMQRAKVEALTLAATENLDDDATQNLVAAWQMENSFAGYLGKFIEPAIEPLGFDWKIGIALITSFAAREVFVGTMATIYSIGSTDDEYSIRDRMAKEYNPLTGEPIYTLGTSLALLLFYVFAMQCMSTLAVVKKETGTWKWPIIQFFYMTSMAYLSALLVYQLLG
jgi:ferrous iron transport protein B